MTIFSTANWKETQSREKGNDHAVAHEDFEPCNYASLASTRVYDLTHFIAEARVYSMSELWVSDIVLHLFVHMTYSAADPTELTQVPAGSSTPHRLSSYSARSIRQRHSQGFQGLL